MSKRRSELNTRRINKRKYYGLGVEISEVKDTFDHHFNHTAAIQSLEDQLVSVGTQSEQLADDIVSQTEFLREDEDAVIDDLEEPYSRSFEKGTRRAFNSEGDQLPAPEAEAQVDQILREQRNYISRLDEDLRSKAREIIRDGIAAGLAKTQIVNNLRSKLKQLQKQRSSTIAESEVVKAGAAGVIATMEANDVDEVVWVASGDSKVCEPGNFNITINGETYTSCRELDGETFSLNHRIPQPVFQTHPNCRCTIAAVD